ncbi:MAG: GNAT family N-acetyltransferase [Bacteroidota bacterium]
MHLIQQEQNTSKGSFYILVDGERLAEMTYSRAGEHMMIIDHTDVSDKLRGQGVGKQLVEHAVEYARTHSIRIMPLCPFAKSVFQKHKELRDVL